MQLRLSESRPFDDHKLGPTSELWRDSTPIQHIIIDIVFARNQLQYGDDRWDANDGSLDVREEPG